MSVALIKWSRPGIIYVAINMVNRKIYVGKTVASLAKRVCNHVYDASHGSRFLFHAAIRKYGKEAFQIFELQQCFGESCLSEAERWWIENLNSLVPNGYNLTRGGEGSILSEETKRKMSEAMKKIMTPEKMKNFREKGHKALRGSTWSPERRARHKVNISPEAIKNRMEGRARNPYVASEEDRRKISEGKLGKPNLKIRGRKFPGRGKGRLTSEEARANLSKAKTEWWSKRKRGECA